MVYFADNRPMLGTLHGNCERSFLLEVLSAHGVSAGKLGSDNQSVVIRTRKIFSS